jgi:hypothetical protein
MAKAYSQDLRERGLDAIEEGGMSRRGAADRFGVSESSAIRWVERTGLRTAVRMGGYKPRKLVLTGNFGGRVGREAGHHVAGTKRFVWTKIGTPYPHGRQNRVVLWHRLCLP